MQHDSNWRQRALTGTQAVQPAQQQQQIQQLPPEILRQALAQYLAQQTMTANGQLSAQCQPVLQGEIVPTAQAYPVHQPYQPTQIQPRFTDECVGGNCPQIGQPLSLHQYNAASGGVVNVHHHHYHV